MIKHVATTGDNNHPGTAAEPWLTIQWGVDQLSAAGGGVLFVHYGSYKESVKMNGAKYSGISIIGVPDPTPTEGAIGAWPCAGRPQVVGLGLGRVWSIRGAQRVLLRYLTLTGGEAVVGSGGALFVREAQVDIEYCCILSNTAAEGGGLSFQGCRTGRTSHVSDCRFEQNEAKAALPVGPSVSADGGAISIGDSGDVEISSCMFFNNTAQEGGGGAIAIAESDHILVHDDCLFEKNAASNTTVATASALAPTAMRTDGFGGAVLVSSCLKTPPTITIEGNRFRQNHADLCGGAIAFQLSYGEIRNNRIESNDATLAGGGIALLEDDAALPGAVDIQQRRSAGQIVQMRDNEIDDNWTEQWGGGVYLALAAIVQMHDNKLKKNRARQGGGGMAVMLNSLAMLDRNDELTANRAELGDGGGLYVQDSHAWVRLARFVGNEALQASGGAVCVVGRVNAVYANYPQGDFEVSIADCQLLRNRAKDGGGMSVSRLDPAIHVWLEIRRTSLEENRAEGGHGGGFLIQQVERPVVQDQNTLSGNQATGGRGGGGAFVECASPLFYHNGTPGVALPGTVVNCAADAPGLLFDRCVDPRVEQSFFAANTLVGGSTPGVPLDLQFEYCTLGMSAAQIVAANLGSPILRII